MNKKTISQLWNDIFDRYDVLKAINDTGFFKITADQIKEFKEPRLMTKFDFSASRPNIFRDNNLGILPIRNGEYIIGKFDLYEDISKLNLKEIEPKIMELPYYIETIDPDNIYSESNALNVALLSGMLEETIGEELFETISGRMRANEFDFKVASNGAKTDIIVSGPQMEIDGGYEGKTKIVLVEAKNTVPEDFIIRQLYYPYRYWKTKTGKEIVPMFFMYDNGIYTILTYKFCNTDEYNSIELQNIKRFIINYEKSANKKMKIFNSIDIQEELPQNVVPFPQADSFNKVYEVLGLIDNGINNARDISEHFQFDVRQGSYYLSAAKYLGLIKSNDTRRGLYILTKIGFDVLDSDYYAKNEILIKQILKHKAFYETYKFYLENAHMPLKETIIGYVTSSIDDEIEENTLNRRASTVRGWIQWIIGCQI